MLFFLNLSKDMFICIFLIQYNMLLVVCFHFHMCSLCLKFSFNILSSFISVTMVLGVPTVRRSVQSYLLGTLRNLVENIGTQDLNDTLIIVFIAEVNIHLFILTAETCVSN